VAVLVYRKKLGQQKSAMTLLAEPLLGKDGHDSAALEMTSIHDDESAAALLEAGSASPQESLEPPLLPPAPTPAPLSISIGTGAIASSTEVGSNLPKFDPEYGFPMNLAAEQKVAQIWRSTDVGAFRQVPTLTVTLENDEDAVFFFVCSRL
jgi:hypothetical protein